MTGLRAAAPVTSRVLVAVYVLLSLLLLGGAATLDTGSPTQPGASVER